jgi:hypothetical protein
LNQERNQSHDAAEYVHAHGIDQFLIQFFQTAWQISLFVLIERNHAKKGRKNGQLFGQWTQQGLRLRCWVTPRSQKVANNFVRGCCRWNTNIEEKAIDTVRKSYR